MCQVRKAARENNEGEEPPSKKRKGKGKGRGRGKAAAELAGVTAPKDGAQHERAEVAGVEAPKDGSQHEQAEVAGVEAPKDEAQHKHAEVAGAQGPSETKQDGEGGKAKKTRGPPKAKVDPEKMLAENQALWAAKELHMGIAHAITF